MAAGRKDFLKYFSYKNLVQNVPQQKIQVVKQHASVAETCEEKMWNASTWFCQNIFDEKWYNLWFHLSKSLGIHSSCF